MASVASMGEVTDVTSVKIIRGDGSSFGSNVRLDLRPIWAQLAKKAGYALQMAGHASASIAGAALGIVTSLFGALWKMLQRIFKQAGVTANPVEQDKQEPVDQAVPLQQVAPRPEAALPRDGNVGEAAVHELTPLVQPGDEVVNFGAEVADQLLLPGPDGGLPDVVDLEGEDAQVAAEAAQLAAAKFLEGVADLDKAALVDPSRAAGEVARHVNQSLARYEELSRALVADRAALDEHVKACAAKLGQGPERVRAMLIAGQDAGLLDPDGIARKLHVSTMRQFAELHLRRNELVSLLQGLADEQNGLPQEARAAALFELDRFVSAQMSAQNGFVASEPQSSALVDGGRAIERGAAVEGVVPEMQSAAQGPAQSQPASSVATTSSSVLDEVVGRPSAFDQLIKRSREVYGDVEQDVGDDRPESVRHV